MSKEKQDGYCTICMNKMDKKTIATINGCTHKFCFDCIHKWATDYKNQCPNCKTKFNKIKSNGKETNVPDRNGESIICFHCNEPCNPPNGDPDTDPNFRDFVDCEETGKGLHRECAHSDSFDLNAMVLNEYFCSHCTEFVVMDITFMANDYDSSCDDENVVPQEIMDMIRRDMEN